MCSDLLHGYVLSSAKLISILTLCTFGASAQEAANRQSKLPGEALLARRRLHVHLLFFRIDSVTIFCVLISVCTPKGISDVTKVLSCQLQLRYNEVQLYAKQGSDFIETFWFPEARTCGQKLGYE